MWNPSPFFKEPLKKFDPAISKLICIARGVLPLRIVLMFLTCMGLTIVLSTEYSVGQDVSIRYSGSDLMSEDPFMFARSLQVLSRSEKIEGVVCAVFVYDSEGQSWGNYISREPVRFDSGGPLDCWGPELREVLPGGSFGRSDRVLEQGLLVHADYVTAHAMPVPSDSPIPPHVLAEALYRSTPNIEELGESVGHYPSQMPVSVSKEPRWVAASFMAIPVTESDGRLELSREFQSRPVTVLLGEREN